MLMSVYAKIAAYYRRLVDIYNTPKWVYVIIIIILYVITTARDTIIRT